MFCPLKFVLNILIFGNNYLSSYMYFFFLLFRKCGGKCHYLIYLDSGQRVVLEALNKNYFFGICRENNTLTVTSKTICF